MSIALKWARMFTGILLLALLVYWTDFSAVIRTFKSIRPGLLPACVACGFAVPALQAILLGLVISPFAKVPAAKLFSLTLIGRFFSSFVPTGVGGDLVKGFYLFPHFVSPSQTYGALLMHRLIGAASTCVVALAAGAMFLPSQAQRHASLGLLIALLAAFIISASITLRPFRIADSNRTSAPRSAFGSRALQFTSNVMLAMQAYRRHIGILLVAFVLSGFATILFSGANLVLAAALRVPMNMEQAIIATTASLLITLLAVTPGGIGFGEAGFTAGAGLMGVPAEQAISIALLGRVLSTIVSIMGGLIYLRSPVPLKPVTQAL